MTQTPKRNSPEIELHALLAIMAKLRDPNGGCPWDLVQDFASIAPYTIEEGYEVADAIAANDPDKLLDELGDLLFQVVYHAQMAAERGWFGFTEVAASICGGGKRCVGGNPGWPPCPYPRRQAHAPRRAGWVRLARCRRGLG